MELLCDGIHIHPSVIRNTFKLYDGRVVLISDSMRSAGLSDGDYELGGQKVIVKNSVATLEDGTLAGSSIHLLAAVQNVIRFGVKQEDAVGAATINPATAIGMGDTLGSITMGKVADFVVFNQDYDIVDVFQNGKQCKQR